MSDSLCPLDRHRLKERAASKPLSIKGEAVRYRRRHEDLGGCHAGWELLRK